MLNAVIHGEPGEAPPLAVVHGLFGSARNWGAIAKRLSKDRQVIVPDMRNHGASPWKDSHTYADLAADLAELLPDECDVVGHSMGGKAAMMLALERPERVRRLVVADIAPVAYGHTQRHLIEAMQGVDLSQVQSRGDADRLLGATVEDPGVRAFLLQSLDVKEKKWRLNFEVLDRDMDLITGWPEVGGSFDKPALFLTGAASTYVGRGDREKIKSLFPQAKFAAIPGAGHWLHAEKPREFEAAVRVFLGMPAA